MRRKNRFRFVVCVVSAPVSVVGRKNAKGDPEKGTVSSKGGVGIEVLHHCHYLFRGVPPVL